MAGSWIKMRHDLIDAPEVRRIGKALGLDRDQVYGKLFRLWSWADRHGKNGVIDAEIEDVDEQVGHQGFAATLVSVGWLGTKGGIVIPNWDRHNSESAKIRGLSANRMRKSRCATSATDLAHPVAQDASPEKRRGDIPPPPTCAALPEARAALRSAWEAAARKGHVAVWESPRLPDKADARLSEPGWLEDALVAIQRLQRCRYFDAGPATLTQLCGPGFVQRVIGGQYDNPKPAGRARGGGGGIEEKAPPRVWSGPEDEIRRRMLAELEAKKQEATA